MQFAYRQQIGSVSMPSIVDDFAFIAKRVQEIRAARYLELGVSSPNPPEPPPRVATDTATGGGFRYAPGFEHLADSPPG
jgi:hypothetical protein